MNVISDYNRYFRGRNLLLTDIKKEAKDDSPLSTGRTFTSTEGRVELTFISAALTPDELMDDILYGLIHKKFGITADTLTKGYPELFI